MAPSAYGQSNLPPQPAHMTAIPANPQMQARPEDAGARTQASDPRFPMTPAVAFAPPQQGQVAGAATNLSLSKDSPPEVRAEPAAPRRSPLVFAIPAIALVAGFGIVVGVKMRGSATKDPSTSNGNGIVYSATNVTPPQPPLATSASSTPSAATSLAALEHDAGATASAKPNPTGRPNPPTSTTTTAVTAPPPATTPSSRLGNTTLIP